ncbi:hypothetical protein PG993_011658 [Apiospora rasikravindrae]|uniref:Uncharacterized protein n=1 Tax=Apiospora rasikravindrae TaxID=990691 RepID=A0ABR1S087_9PEZI
MPATVKIAYHEANLIYRPEGVDSSKSLLETLHGIDNPGRFYDEGPKKSYGGILQSSVEGHKLPPVLLAHKNGFVNAVARAYSSHHHLIIRPDDIWLAIISQFSIYVNKHAEELRGKFVAHEGQKELVIVYDNATRHTVDFANFARQISDLISENVVDDEICGWIKPAFSITTGDDVVVANIMVMGTLQAYFSFSCMMICGIPSVTLQGTKQDYEEILRRLDKLAYYGEEPDAFSDLLRPVVRCFIRSFEEPEHPDVRRFWEMICDEHRGSGMDYYSGWITAFCFWNGQGKRQVFPGYGYLLEDMGYGRVEMKDVPSGFTKVPVHLNDNGHELEAEMIAGSVGVNCTSSGKPSANGETGLDTMQNHLGWFIYEKP